MPSFLDLDDEELEDMFGQTRPSRRKHFKRRQDAEDITASQAPPEEPEPLGGYAVPSMPRGYRPPGGRYSDPYAGAEPGSKGSYSYESAGRQHDYDEPIGPQLPSFFGAARGIAPGRATPTSIGDNPAYTWTQQGRYGSSQYSLRQGPEGMYMIGRGGGGSWTVPGFMEGATGGQRAAAAAHHPNPLKALGIEQSKEFDVPGARFMHSDWESRYTEAMKYRISAERFTQNPIYAENAQEELGTGYYVRGSDTQRGIPTSWFSHIPGWFTTSGGKLSMGAKMGARSFTERGSALWAEKRGQLMAQEYARLGWGETGRELPRTYSRILSQEGGQEWGYKRRSFMALEGFAPEGMAYTRPMPEARVFDIHKKVIEGVPEGYDVNQLVGLSGKYGGTIDLPGGPGYDVGSWHTANIVGAKRLEDQRVEISVQRHMSTKQTLNKFLGHKTQDVEADIGRMGLPQEFHKLENAPSEWRQAAAGIVGAWTNKEAQRYGLGTDPMRWNEQTDDQIYRAFLRFAGERDPQGNYVNLQRRTLTGAFTPSELAGFGGRVQGASIGGQQISLPGGWGGQSYEQRLQYLTGEYGEGARFEGQISTLGLAANILTRPTVATQAPGRGRINRDLIMQMAQTNPAAARMLLEQTDRYRAPYQRFQAAALSNRPDSPISVPGLDIRGRAGAFREALGSTEGMSEYEIRQRQLEVLGGMFGNQALSVGGKTIAPVSSVARMATQGPEDRQVNQFVNQYLETVVGGMDPSLDVSGQASKLAQTQEQMLLSRSFREGITQAESGQFIKGGITGWSGLGSNIVMNRGDIFRMFGAEGEEQRNELMRMAESGDLPALMMRWPTSDPEAQLSTTLAVRTPEWAQENIPGFELGEHAYAVGSEVIAAHGGDFDWDTGTVLGMGRFGEQGFESMAEISTMKNLRQMAERHPAGEMQSRRSKLQRMVDPIRQIARGVRGQQVSTDKLGGFLGELIANAKASMGAAYNVGQRWGGQFFSPQGMSQLSSRLYQVPLDRGELSSGAQDLLEAVQKTSMYTKESGRIGFWTKGQGVVDKMDPLGDVSQRWADAWLRTSELTGSPEGMQTLAEALTPSGANQADVLQLLQGGDLGSAGGRHKVISALSGMTDASSLVLSGAPGMQMMLSAAAGRSLQKGRIPGFERSGLSRSTYGQVMQAAKQGSSIIEMLRADRGSYLESGDASVLSRLLSTGADPGAHPVLRRQYLEQEARARAMGGGARTKDAAQVTTRAAQASGPIDDFVAAEIAAMEADPAMYEAGGMVGGAGGGMPPPAPPNVPASPPSPGGGGEQGGGQGGNRWSDAPQYLTTQDVGRMRAFRDIYAPQSAAMFQQAMRSGRLPSNMVGARRVMGEYQHLLRLKSSLGTRQGSASNIAQFSEMWSELDEGDYGMTFQAARQSMPDWEAREAMGKMTPAAMARMKPQQEREWRAATNTLKAFSDQLKEATSITTDLNKAQKAQLKRAVTRMSDIEGYAGEFEVDRAEKMMQALGRGESWDEEKFLGEYATTKTGARNVRAAQMWSQAMGDPRQRNLLRQVQGMLAEQGGIPGEERDPTQNERLIARFRRQAGEADSLLGRAGYGAAAGLLGGAQWLSSGWGLMQAQRYWRMGMGPQLQAAEQYRDYSLQISQQLAGSGLIQAGQVGGAGGQALELARYREANLMGRGRIANEAFYGMQSAISGIGGDELAQRIQVAGGPALTAALAGGQMFRSWQGALGLGGAALGFGVAAQAIGSMNAPDEEWARWAGSGSSFDMIKADPFKAMGVGLGVITGQVSQQDLANMQNSGFQWNQLRSGNLMLANAPESMRASLLTDWATSEQTAQLMPFMSSQQRISSRLRLENLYGPQMQAQAQQQRQQELASLQAQINQTPGGEDRVALQEQYIRLQGSMVGWSPSDEWLQGIGTLTTAGVSIDSLMATGRQAFNVGRGTQAELQMEQGYARNASNIITAQGQAEMSAIQMQAQYMPSLVAAGIQDLAPWSREQDRNSVLPMGYSPEDLYANLTENEQTVGANLISKLAQTIESGGVDGPVRELGEGMFRRLTWQVSQGDLTGAGQELSNLQSLASFAQTAGTYGTWNSQMAGSMMSLIQSGGQQAVSRQQQLLQGNLNAWSLFGDENMLGINLPFAPVQTGAHGGTAGMQWMYDTAPTDAAWSRMAGGASTGYMLERLGIGREMYAGGTSGIERNMFMEQQRMRDATQAYQLQQSRFSYAQDTGVGMGEFLPGQEGIGSWYFQDQNRALRREQQDYQMGQKQRQMARSDQDFEMQMRQFMERWNFNYNRTTTQFGWQEQDRAFQRTQQLQSRQWSMEDTSYQESRRDLGYAWQMEDYDEAIRFARGRERRKLERQRERSTISYSMGVSHDETVKQRQETIWSQEDERFEIEGQRAQQQRTWTLEQMEMEKRHFMERRQLSEQSFQEQRKQIEMEIQWMQRERELEDQQIQFQRQVYEVRHKMESAWQQEQMRSANLLNQYTVALQAANTVYTEVIKNLQYSVSTMGATQAAASAAPASSTTIFRQSMPVASTTPAVTTGTRAGFTAGSGIGYASGGYTGRGHKYQVAGVVHKDEYVVPSEGALVKSDSPEQVNLLSQIRDLLAAIERKGLADVKISLLSDTGRPEGSIEDFAYAG